MDQPSKPSVRKKRKPRLAREVTGSVGKALVNIERALRDIPGAEQRQKVLDTALSLFGVESL